MQKTLSGVQEKKPYHMYHTPHHPLIPSMKKSYHHIHRSAYLESSISPKIAQTHITPKGEKNHIICIIPHVTHIIHRAKKL